MFLALKKVWIGAMTNEKNVINITSLSNRVGRPEGVIQNLMINLRRSGVLTLILT